MGSFAFGVAALVDVQKVADVALAVMGLAMATDVAFKVAGFVLFQSKKKRLELPPPVEGMSPPEKRIGGTTDKGVGYL